MPQGKNFQLVPDNQKVQANPESQVTRKVKNPIRSLNKEIRTTEGELGLNQDTKA